MGAGPISAGRSSRTVPETSAIRAVRANAKMGPSGKGSEVPRNQGIAGGGPNLCGVIIRAGSIRVLCTRAYEPSMLYIRGTAASDRGYAELRRTPLPRTRVNKGKRKGYHPSSRVSARLVKK